MRVLDFPSNLHEIYIVQPTLQGGSEGRSKHSFLDPFGQKKKKQQQRPSSWTLPRELLSGTKIPSRFSPNKRRLPSRIGSS